MDWNTEPFWVERSVIRVGWITWNRSQIIVLLRHENRKCGGFCAIGVLQLYKYSYGFLMHIPIIKQKPSGFGEGLFLVAFRTVHHTNEPNLGLLRKFLRANFQVTRKECARRRIKIQNFENPCKTRSNISLMMHHAQRQLLKVPTAQNPPLFRFFCLRSTIIWDRFQLYR